MVVFKEYPNGNFIIENNTNNIYKISFKKDEVLFYVLFLERFSKVDIYEDLRETTISFEKVK